MKRIILNEKKLRKRMIDLDIKTINELATKSGISKPTIYEYLNGHSPVLSTYLKLCDFLDIHPMELLDYCDNEINLEEKNNV